MEGRSEVEAYGDSLLVASREIAILPFVIVLVAPTYSLASASRRQM